MFSISIETSVDTDNLIAELWDAGTLGITEEYNRLVAFFDDEKQGEVLKRFAHYHPSHRGEEERDWVLEVQNAWHPFPVGKRWWLAPEWHNAPPPDNRIVLRIHPGMACGTGWHAATQLCLCAMETSVRVGQSVLDVGTGSGILADAADLLGAAPVFACDIDPDATGVARGNATSASLFTGSLRSVRNRAVDVIVANLNAVTCRSLRAEMERVVRRGGTLILSGFREEEAGTLGFGEGSVSEQDGWACLVLQR